MTIWVTLSFASILNSFCKVDGKWGKELPVGDSGPSSILDTYIDFPSVLTAEFGSFCVTVLSLKQTVLFSGFFSSIKLCKSLSIKVFLTDDAVHTADLSSEFDKVLVALIWHMKDASSQLQGVKSEADIWHLSSILKVLGLRRTSCCGSFSKDFLRDQSDAWASCVFFSAIEWEAELTSLTQDDTESAKFSFLEKKNIPKNHVQVKRLRETPNHWVMVGFQVLTIIFKTVEWVWEEWPPHYTYPKSTVAASWIRDLAVVSICVDWKIWGWTGWTDLEKGRDPTFPTWMDILEKWVLGLRTISPTEAEVSSWKLGIFFWGAMMSVCFDWMWGTAIDSLWVPEVYSSPLTGSVVDLWSRGEVKLSRLRDKHTARGSESWGNQSLRHGNAVYFQAKITKAKESHAVH